MHVCVCDARACICTRELHTVSISALSFSLCFSARFMAETHSALIFLNGLKEQRKNSNSLLVNFPISGRLGLQGGQLSVSCVSFLSTPQFMRFCRLDAVFKLALRSALVLDPLVSDLNLFPLGSKGRESSKSTSRREPTLLFCDEQSPCMNNKNGRMTKGVSREVGEERRSEEPNELADAFLVGGEALEDKVKSRHK